MRAFLIVGCFRRYVGTKCTLHACRSMQLEHVDRRLYWPILNASQAAKMKSLARRSADEAPFSVQPRYDRAEHSSLPGDRCVPIGSSPNGMVRKALTDKHRNRTRGKKEAG